MDGEKTASRCADVDGSIENIVITLLMTHGPLFSIKYKIWDEWKFHQAGMSEFCPEFQILEFLPVLVPENELLILVILDFSNGILAPYYSERVRGHIEKEGLLTDEVQYMNRIFAIKHAIILIILMD